VQVEALAVRLRPRTQMEAADLGIRLCRRHARSVYTCYGLVALPLMALAMASYELGSWLPGTVIWLSKPWLDRTILFVLSRAAFGQSTTPGDVWRAQRDVWWRQLLLTWTLQRLSPWRSLTQPVYQLEGLPFFKAGARVRQIKRRAAGSAFMMTQVFSVSENALTFALVSLIFWFAPAGSAPDPFDALTGEMSTVLIIGFPIAYAAVVLFLEPFYVAAGFAMYLHRRAELEAWDIEQEFRRAFSTPIALIALGGLLAIFAPSVASAQSAPPGRDEITRALEAVKADPNLAAERTITTLRWNEGPQRAARSTPAWMAWIAGLFGWMEQSARVLVWTAAAVLVGLLVVYLLRIARAARAARDAEPFVAPTHVRDLDIRPETLPDDIGHAARVLWDRGNHRAALALLYRGLLSRLAHVHRLPIRDSTTEGDCLVLAATHLPQPRREYAAELVRLWQRAVYGGEHASSPSVHALCDGFAAALDSSPARDAIGGGAS
jgi:hypothetical protein